MRHGQPRIRPTAIASPRPTRKELAEAQAEPSCAATSLQNVPNELLNRLEITQVLYGEQVSLVPGMHWLLIPPITHCQNVRADRNAARATPSFARWTSRSLSLGSVGSRNGPQ